MSVLSRTRSASQSPSSASTTSREVLGDAEYVNAVPSTGAFSSAVAVTALFRRCCSR